MPAIDRRELLMQILESGDVISTDGYLNAAKVSTNTTYWKRDFVIRAGTWRGVRVSPLILNPNLTRSHTIVLGHADAPTNAAILLLLKALGATRVFGTNVATWRRFARPIPLGLTNDCDDGPLHRTLGNVHHLREALGAAEREVGYNGRILANFSVDNAPQYRRNLASWAQAEPNVDWVEPDLSDEGRVAFLRDIRRHDFVLCPRGNGCDTHRLWETLYMGSIPVVRRSEINATVLEGLPVLVVDEWNALRDPYFRRAQWDRLSRPGQPVDRLRLSWWIQAMASNDFKE
jgi:hypothetical protein